MNGRRSRPENRPRRILCVSSNFPRWEGDSTPPFVLNLAHDLQRLGWVVDVLAPHASGCATREEIQGVTVERFRYLWPTSAQTVCYQGGALINLRKNKANFFKLPALIAAEVMAVMRRLTSGTYDLLHTHWLLPQGFVGALAGKVLRVPHVTTIHGGDVFALNGGSYEPFKKFALRGADAVTVNSSATREAVLTIVPDLPRVACIPMGISVDTRSSPSLDSSDLRARYGSDGQLLILFVGRVVLEKGVAELIRSISVLSSRGLDVAAMIVGQGQDGPAMEQLATTLKVQDRVHFVGWVDPEDLGAYYRAADVYVGPSHTEGQGLTFLEAMAAGTPVVATNTGGLRDIVFHEETAMLIDHDSPDGIADAVLRIADDKDLADRMCMQAGRVAREKYSRAASAQRFSELFELLLA